jgi:hypothetical protein
MRGDEHTALFTHAIKEARQIAGQRALGCRVWKRLARRGRFIFEASSDIGLRGLARGKR